jgi:hypothetical protein
MAMAVAISRVCRDPTYSLVGANSRGSGWATDWSKAVQGLHELAHAADCPLRKGAGLIFLPAQEKQEIERSAVTK